MCNTVLQDPHLEHIPALASISNSDSVSRKGCIWAWSSTAAGTSTIDILPRLPESSSPGVSPQGSDATSGVKLLSSSAPTRQQRELRDHFVYVPSQWEMMLHCNLVPHWLGTYTKWSLRANTTFKTLKPGNNGWHFVDIFKYICLNQMWVFGFNFHWNLLLNSCNQ